jgi:hypothetical protein
VKGRRQFHGSCSRYRTLILSREVQYIASAVSLLHIPIPSNIHQAHHISTNSVHHGDRGHEGYATHRFATVACSTRLTCSNSARHPLLEHRPPRQHLNSSRTQHSAHFAAPSRAHQPHRSFRLSPHPYPMPAGSVEHPCQSRTASRSLQRPRDFVPGSFYQADRHDAIPCSTGPHPGVLNPCAHLRMMHLQWYRKP